MYDKLNATVTCQFAGTCLSSLALSLSLTPSRSLLCSRYLNVFIFSYFLSSALLGRICPAKEVLTTLDSILNAFVDLRHKLISSSFYSNVQACVCECVYVCVMAFAAYAKFSIISPSTQQQKISLRHLKPKPEPKEPLPLPSWSILFCEICILHTAYECECVCVNVWVLVWVSCVAICSVGMGECIQVIVFQCGILNCILPRDWRKT